MLESLDVRAEMLCAVRCLRSEGIKTALLTNNFNLPERRHLPLVDASLFDVVSRSHSGLGFIVVVIIVIFIIIIIIRQQQQQQYCHYY